MTIITGLTDDPAQTNTVILEDGSTAILSLNYSPQQTGWFFGIQYPFNGFVLTGQRLCAFPNVLTQFSSKIPFGIACVTTNNTEPLGQETFVDGTTDMYLLNSNDCVFCNDVIFANTNLTT